MCADHTGLKDIGPEVLNSKPKPKRPYPLQSAHKQSDAPVSITTKHGFGFRARIPATGLLSWNLI